MRKASVGLIAVWAAASLELLFVLALHRAELNDRWEARMGATFLAPTALLLGEELRSTGSGGGIRTVLVGGAPGLDQSEGRRGIQWHQLADAHPEWMARDKVMKALRDSNRRITLVKVLQQLLA